MVKEQQQSEAQNGGGQAGTISPPLSSPVTGDQFLSWKLRKDAEAAMKKEEEVRKRKEDIESGKVKMNGRELFLHEPWVFDNELY